MGKGFEFVSMAPARFLVYSNYWKLASTPLPPFDKDKKSKFCKNAIKLFRTTQHKKLTLLIANRYKVLPASVKRKREMLWKPAADQEGASCAKDFHF